MLYDAHCADGKVCDSIRTNLRSYYGIRYTSDGFDCALPVAIDSHSLCSFGCLYCFADNLIEHGISSKSRPIGQMSLNVLEGIFSGKPTKISDSFRKALKYDKRNADGFPCPIQLGAICEPADNIERNQGWLLDFIKLANKWGQPVRMSTKGNLFLIDEYLDAISECPELFWVAWSIITPDDDLIKKIDLRAPPTSERIASMKRLSDRGVKCSLRLRPILPGFSDSTPKYPQAYKTLIQMAADAGAVAISYEVGFMPGHMTPELKVRWEEIERLSNRPLNAIYNHFGKQACTRPSYIWTENIMHAIKEEALKCGLTVGVSDPVWKQLSDTGCCCGILPDDPVFGNWQRESATNILLESKKTGDFIHLKDITPPWSHDQKLPGMVASPPGPAGVYLGRHTTWAEKLREIWNNTDSERGPLNYFQGALQPDHWDENGDIVYKYVGLKRRMPEKIPFWEI